MNLNTFLLISLLLLGAQALNALEEESAHESNAFQELFARFQAENNQAENSAEAQHEEQLVIEDEPSVIETMNDSQTFEDASVVELHNENNEEPAFECFEQQEQQEN